MALSIHLTADPNKIAQGGVVTLAVAFPEEPQGQRREGVYLFTWHTEGPVTSRAVDPSRAFTLSRAQRTQLGRAATEELIVVLDPNEPIRAAWDTSDLRPGAYGVQLDVAMQDPRAQSIQDRIAQSDFVLDAGAQKRLEDSFDANALGSDSKVGPTVGDSETVTVVPRPFKSGDDVFVTMRR